jgi:hypothetical protein
VLWFGIQNGAPSNPRQGRDRVKEAFSNWEEFEDAAGGIFKVWVDGRELAWAKQAWLKLAESGLTDYSTERERTEVCIRLMTLGVIYLDFCYHAWEEDGYPDFSGWAAVLEIQPFQIGRLIEAAHASDFVELEPRAEEAEFLADAFLTLTDSERPRIHSALCASKPKGFITVYRDLHQTRRIPSEDSGDDPWEVTPGNSSAFEFVENGFDRLRDYG